MRGKSARILIVEDEIVVALSLKAVIEDLGHEVAGIALTGEEAIGHIDGDAPDLVIMDINLGSGMDGIETARRVSETHGLPVIFLTGYSKGETIGGVEGVPAYMFLRKPVKEAVLDEAINRALGDSRGRSVP